MYSPPYNRVDDRRELVEFLRANNFPVLVTGTGGTLHASHLPVVVTEEDAKLVLDMHMARANAQWKEFFDEDALVIFTGPHAYVSPRWYEEKPRVPTWNYAAVHCYGIPQLIEDPAAKKAGQRRLIEMMDPQWLPEFDRLPEKYVTMMLEGIVNFRIPVTRIETRWKLSQNRGRREMELIVAALERGGEKPLAELMRRHFVAE